MARKIVKALLGGPWEWAIGIGICILIAMNWETFDRRFLQAPQRADDYFHVGSIVVPDFYAGGNPVMQYNRIIKKPFRARWVVEVHRLFASGPSNACTGNGVNDYDPGEKLPAEGVRWQWFIGKPCKVGPGRYVLDVKWRMRVGKYGDRVAVRARSNVFTVNSIARARALNKLIFEQADRDAEIKRGRRKADP